MKKKLILITGMCVALFSTPVHAFTPSQANAYFKGVNDLGNMQKICDLNGYRSMLTDIPLKTFYDDPNYYELYGLTFPYQKIIMIGTNQSDAYIEYTTIHEYGHALACLCQLKETGVLDALFAEMPFLYDYQLTHNPLNPRALYCAYSPEEYFSEALGMYYFHRSALKKCCPVTYNYIQALDKMFNGR